MLIPISPPSIPAFAPCRTVGCDELTGPGPSPALDGSQRKHRSTWTAHPHRGASASRSATVGTSLVRDQRCSRHATGTVWRPDDCSVLVFGGTLSGSPWRADYLSWRELWGSVLTWRG